MTNEISSISKYNLFFLFFCIIWEPVRIYYINIDGAGRMILALSIIAFFLNYSSLSIYKKVFRSTSFICWTVLVLFSFLNSMAHGFVWEHGTVPYINTNFINPYVFLLIATIEMVKDQNRCLKVVLIALLIYLFIGSLHVTLGEYDRYLSENLGNLLPLMAAGASFVAGVLLCNRQLKGGGITYGVIVVFVLTIIIMSATRKALGSVVLSFAGTILGFSKKLSIKTFLPLAVAFIIFQFGMDYVMENTLMGERLASSSQDYEVPLSSNPVVNNFLMSLLGDRAMQYYLAIDVFHKHPVFGIGLNNFMYVAHFDLRLHTEYMVQLCENGLVGISLLVVFYITLFKGLKRKQHSGSNTMVYLFGLLMVLFLNLTAWTYNMQIVLIIYAVLLSYIHSTQNSNENSYSSSQGQLQ